MIKLKLKKNDHVAVISGKDRGKSGEILKVFPREGRVIVKGVGIAKRHLKKKGGQSGRVVEVERPIQVSNVMLIDPKEKKPTRIGRRVEAGKLVRFAKKSGTALT